MKLAVSWNTNTHHILTATTTVLLDRGLKMKRREHSTVTTELLKTPEVQRFYFFFFFIL